MMLCPECSVRYEAPPVGAGSPGPGACQYCGQRIERGSRPAAIARGRDSLDDGWDAPEVRGETFRSSPPAAPDSAPVVVTESEISESIEPPPGTTDAVFVHAQRVTLEPESEVTAVGSELDALDLLDANEEPNDELPAVAPTPKPRMDLTPAAPREVSVQDGVPVKAVSLPALAPAGALAGATKKTMLRRSLPLAGALAAVVVAFVIGVRVGRSSSAPAVTESAPLAAATHAAHSPPDPLLRPPAPTKGAPETSPASRQGPIASAPTPEEAAPLPAPSPTVRGKARSIGFSTKAATLSLSNAIVRARACKKAGEPSRVAYATITFATNGTVSNVAVSGAKVTGTPLATCIAEELRAARVPAFRGEPAIVKRTVRLR